MQQPVSRRIAENLAQVRQAALQASGSRGYDLVCVTKYAKPLWMTALLEAGATQLGENLLPQAATRFQQLRLDGFRFTAHLLGAPQSRRIRLVPGCFDWLQALDSVASANSLQRCCEDLGVGLKVLVQVNIATEPSKRGVPPHSAGELCEHIDLHCPRLALRGLMAIPPAPDEFATAREFEVGSRAYFSAMRDLFDRMGASRSTLGSWDTLSMGMSQDYVWALEAGSTMIRVGSALFQGLEG